MLAATCGGLQLRLCEQRGRLLSQTRRDIGPANKGSNCFELVCVTAKVIRRLGHPFVIHEAIMPKSQKSRVPQ